jgi:FO synthase subunit 1
MDYINPAQPWPNIEELYQICSKNGFHLKERLPIYDKFINKEGFISENIKKILRVIN